MNATLAPPRSVHWSADSEGGNSQGIHMFHQLLLKKVRAIDVSSFLSTTTRN